MYWHESSDMIRITIHGLRGNILQYCKKGDVLQFFSIILGKLSQYKEHTTISIKSEFKKVFSSENQDNSSCAVAVRDLKKIKQTSATNLCMKTIN